MDAASLLPFQPTIYPKEEIKVCISIIISVVPEYSALVVVAMSGGVDSSVTAALLAQEVIQALLIIKNAVVTMVPQDYDLSAVFMRNWDTRDESGSNRGCEWERDWEDVQGVCKVLDIPCDLVRHTSSHLSIA